MFNSYCNVCGLRKMARQSSSSSSPSLSSTLNFDSTSTQCTHCPIVAENGDNHNRPNRSINLHSKIENHQNHYRYNNSNSNNDEDENDIPHLVSPANAFYDRHILAQSYAGIAANLSWYCSTIIADMSRYGFCLIDNFVTAQIGDAIRAEVAMLRKRCTITSVSARRRTPLVVSIDGVEPNCGNIGYLRHIFDSIIARCNATRIGAFAAHNLCTANRSKALVSFGSSYHFASSYPSSASSSASSSPEPDIDYNDGDDNNSNNNDRNENIGKCIACIYYPDKDDQQKARTVFRLCPKSSHLFADIEPKFNRALFFWFDLKRRNRFQMLLPTFEKSRNSAITVLYHGSNQNREIVRHPRPRPPPPPPHHHPIGYRQHFHPYLSNRSTDQRRSQSIRDAEKRVVPKQEPIEEEKEIPTSSTNQETDNQNLTDNNGKGYFFQDNNNILLDLRINCDPLKRQFTDLSNNDNKNPRIIQVAT